MPTLLTQGAASARAYGFGASSAAVNYIEDVFSTYLYTGNSSTNSIVNNIDLSTKGGLVWIKNRSASAGHTLTDTSRGVSSQLSSDSTSQAFNFNAFSSFNNNGFTVYSSDSYVNVSGNNYASWTFRKQPKFFDVVTYTGNGANGTAYNISHSLGSKPGAVIIKRADSTGNWAALMRVDDNNTSLLNLNTTGSGNSNSWIKDRTTTTTFDVGTTSYTATNWNINGATYVAYLFAHNAGGFGATGTDNVISCGSFTTDASGNATVNLGYEPQWVILKNATTVSNNEWRMVDNMRGFPLDGASSSVLAANSSAAEFTSGTINVLNTGIQIDGLANSATFIYIAIRRGPMKTPTTGTSVFVPKTRTGTGSAATVTGIGFAPDMLISENRASSEGWITNRVASFSNTNAGYLYTAYNLAEFAANSASSGVILDGTATGSVSLTAGSNLNISGASYVDWFFRRAPGFFDVVCYTGNGDNTNGITISHNLGVAPQVIICKRRSAVADWYTSWAPILGYGTNNEGYLNTTASFINGGKLANAPTATTFKWTDASGLINASGSTYVAYLFATVAGVSKVGSYTGTGTTKQIDCGFTSGARFVLIKRTDSTGDWYVWDSVRGIVAGNDPYLLLNSNAAEVTSTDYVDTYSAGFEISSTAPAAINANGGSFVYLAIS